MFERAPLCSTEFDIFLQNRSYTAPRHFMMGWRLAACLLLLQAAAGVSAAILSTGGPLCSSILCVPHLPAITLVIAVSAAAVTMSCMLYNRRGSPRSQVLAADSSDTVAPSLLPVARRSEQQALTGAAPARVVCWVQGLRR